MGAAMTRQYARQQESKQQRQPGAVKRAREHAAVQPSGGQPLGGALRADMEARFGRDFAHVRLHTDGRAAALAMAQGARAYTLGHDIVFGTRQYSPHTAGGQRLLAHELAHVVQGEGAAGGQVHAAAPALVPPSSPLEQDAEQSADQAMQGRAAAPAARAAAPAILRTAADDLISTHTSWGDLKEDALGQALLGRALGGEYAFVIQVLDALGSTDRDDVAYELCRAAQEDALQRIAAAEEGRRLLDRMYDELTAGSVADEELEQADRIMRAKAQRITPAAVEQGILHAKIFPFRLPGLTVLSDAPFSAERRPGGRIWVKQPVRVLGTDEFRSETRTLPTEVFTSGVELPENEIIGVKMYDLGGEIHYRPALYLMQLANTTDATIAAKMGETAFIGLTLGAGSLAAGAGELGLAARALLWADRIAFALGTLTSLIREHRGWILATFGERGATFLQWNDRISSAVAIYGGVRAVVGLVQLVNGLRTAFRDWNAYRQTLRLAEEESRVANNVASNTDELLRSFDQAELARAAPANDVAPLPANVVRLQPGSRGGGASAGGSAPGTPVVASRGGPMVEGTSALAPAATPVAVAPPVQAPLAQVIPIRPGIQPAPAPAPAPVPTPARALAPGAATMPALNPALIPQPQPQGQQDDENQPIEIRLLLPSQKAFHAATYAGLIRERRLVHLKNNPREHDAQADKWDSELQPDGEQAIYPEIWQWFADLNVAENRRLRPNWTRQGDRVAMQVDHRVELQVCPPNDTTWGDSFANYELLDQPSNGSSGSQLKANIAAERVRLALLTGDPTWAQRDLRFTRLIVQPGPAGSRWQADEIHEGKHYWAYVRSLEGRTR